MSASAWDSPLIVPWTPERPAALDEGPVVCASVPLLFTDCETDGLGPDRRAWEVAAIRREPDGTHWVVHTLVEPEFVAPDRVGLEIGGFPFRHPHADLVYRARGWELPDGWDNQRAQGYLPVVSEAEAVMAVNELAAGAHVVGSVPGFDVEVYRAALGREESARAMALLSADRGGAHAEVVRRRLRETSELLAWRGHYHLIDVENLVAGRLGLLPPWESDGLSRAVGVRPPGEGERHTALGDTVWAMELWDATMRVL